MDRTWLITNPGSGSVSDARSVAVAAAIGQSGMTLVGRTLFPTEPLPQTDMLEAGSVDTIVLFAGDGTINAAACALEEFAGTMLILPGGTMNMLARRLHGDADTAAILKAAIAGAEAHPLPVVEAGPHRAFVALIVGPAAHWAHAREALRAGRFRRIWRTARMAWRRTTTRGVAVRGVPALRGRHQALIVSPGVDEVAVAAIRAQAISAMLRLGLSWIGSDWRSDKSVRTATQRSLVIDSRRPVPALFDGEPVTLYAPVTITGGESRLRFLTTRTD